MALIAVIHFMNSDNPEFINYAESLKESLIDCYLCLTHSIYLQMDIKDKEFENAFIKLQELKLRFYTLLEKFRIFKKSS